MRNLAPPDTAPGRKPVERRDLPSTVAIKARNVSKGFPGVQALRGVNFELATGEVHGLVGANGAGKSTFIRMLSGADRPDAGEIEVYGSPIAFDDPRSRRRAGVAAIYQELTVIPEMTALSNAFLGEAPSRFGFTDRREMERRYASLSASMGLSVPPYAKAGALSVANQQMIEIMRAVLAERKILIMDEPTAPLGPAERARLYELIAKLKKDWASIIFISHDLDEVLRLCDRVSVMREGLLVDSRPASRWTKETLVQAMLGDVRAIALDKSAGALNRDAEDLLVVDGVGLPGRVEPMSFSVRRGEVLGVAGLVGAGRTELLRSLAGAEPSATGSIKLCGVEHALPWGVRRAIASGVALAPEDRKRQGLVLSRSSLANLMLADLARVATWGVSSRARARDRGELLARRLGFNPARLGVDALTLSGGNQQKLVLGKWLNRKPRLLLLDEPTRGIDLGAKQEIFEAIRLLTAEGMGVILVSSDLDEVVEHSDRVLVMARGRQIGLLERAEASIERILNLIFAVENRAVSAGAN